MSVGQLYMTIDILGTLLVVGGLVTLVISTAWKEMRGAYDQG